MTFEFDGDKYREASSQQKAWGERLIAELDLKGCESVLDLGCGDGGLTAELAECVPDGFVVGIDASQGMIETARKDHAARNLQFELKDINDIEFESQFDVVFSNATLHWVKDHKRLLSNVYRGLKNGGRLRFQFAGDGNCSNLIEVVRAVMGEKEYAEYFSEFDWPWYMPAVEEYRSLLDEAAFAERRVWGQQADKHFANSDQMVRWLDQPSLVPFLGCIAEKDKARFRDTVVEQMIERTLQKDGTCFETFRRINVFAGK